MHNFTKKTMAVSLALALLVGAGGAFAYWTNTGSGSGTAGTGTNLAVVVKQTTVLTGMYPGQGPQALAGNFDNPNAGATYVAAVTASVTGVDASHSTCLFADYVITGTATVAADVAAGTAKGAWSGLSIQLNNTASNQNACKGATVTITYAST